MIPYRAIRADYDASTIVVYHAFNDEIASGAVNAQRFVSPFSVNRMTWIKPSFLWLMERSGWGTKSRQERILAIRISRTGWTRALSLGVLTSYESTVHGTATQWQQQFADSIVHIQWDPERSMRGGKLDHRSIQVGLSRHIIDEYINEWTEEIIDMTNLVARLRQLKRDGRYTQAKRLLPIEREYPVEASLRQQIGML